MYFDNSKSILPCGWDAACTISDANNLNLGRLSGTLVNLK
jgi:hypothetical protein